VFYLSCRSVALLFVIHHTDAAKRLKMLAKPVIGLLEVVTAGTPTSGKATRYRYIGKDPKP
jgi:TRAP-type mannitol/chloroaromatic compound transport system substrate-binding protein